MDSSTCLPGRLSRIGSGKSDLAGLVFLGYLVDDVVQVDLARGGQDAHGQHPHLAQARV